jgi:hypothetical protein
MATTAPEEKIDLGNIIQRGFETIGRNAPGYLLLSALLAGLPNFFMYYLALGTPTSPDTQIIPVWAFVLLLGFVTWFTSALLQAALLRSAILDLSGRPADIAGSLQSALMLVLPIIGITILSSIGVTLAMLLLIVPGIILYIAWIVAIPVLVEERLGVLASLGRSAELTKGSRWRIFGLLLIFLFFWMIVSGLVATLTPDDPSGISWMGPVVNAVSATIIALFTAAMLASLYVELKTVKEGATSETLATIFA